jgi:4-hydroxybutyrate CoA-transferase
VSWQERYRDKLATADEAVQLVRPGDLVVFALGSGGEPIALGQALGRRAGELRDVRVLHAVANHPYPWLQGPSEAFCPRSIYVGPFERAAVAGRWLDYVPWSYGTASRQGWYDRWGAYTRPDVFMVKVSPPDDDGWCSFGHTVWYSPTASRNARTVLAEVDPTFIRTGGDNRIHVSRVDRLVEGQPWPLTGQMAPVPDDEAEAASVIGALAAELIEDGDCIQVGVGVASQAVLQFLHGKRDLGVHSELLLHEMVQLARAGVVTGARKTVHPGKMVATCYILWPGTEEQRDAAAWIDGNPDVELYDIGYVTHVPRIAAHDRFVAINSALAIDLTGQVAIDTMGATPYSGTGGGLDFVVGANFSEGGRAIHAMLSTAGGGEISRIVPQFGAGAVPTIPRNYVDFVVTEYGVASLQGKSLRERAQALITIAHPRFRDELEAAARRLFWP